MQQRLAELVRERRALLGWTQGELAAAMGSSPSRISKLESADPSVALDLMLRALEIMEGPLRIAFDKEQDVFSEAALSYEERRQLSARLLRRRRAERIAERHRVDPGDVEHALFNLTLPPWQRLARSFRRAGLRRLPAH
jgi:transcriptional regulator with XRE-family HTH domain